jgi:xylulokinase
MAVYLGLDASTQSLTATLIEVDADGRRDVIIERSIVFERDLPAYGTDHGVLRGADPAIVTSPPLMWVEALDMMMAALADDQPDVMARLAAISGSAQQHGSVYLNADGISRLSALDPARPLAAQLVAGFSRQLSPVWMDSSTTAECREIETAVGGAAVLARHTGARAFERFTGPQIRAFAHRDPTGYQATRRVHLVSSFMASLLSGTDAPIDHGDGSGMNLMDLASRSWWPPAVDATAPDLAARLPALAPSWSVAGALAPYWQHRYGLPPARVVVWSGDNPCSLIGSGLVREGRLAVSLGTSDTVCGLMRDLRIHDDGIGYVSAAPTGDYMGTTVFKNGSLAREHVRDGFGLDWAGFSTALAAAPAGNDGRIMLPWFDPEITPHVATPGVRRINLDPHDVPGNVRAIVEAQMMAMANHTRWMSADTSVIYATGGAAGNRAVLQVMADVFDADVVRSRTRHSAALGAALRAWHADQIASGRPMEWDDVVAGFTTPDPAWRFRPQPDAVAIYADLRRRYAEAERAAMAYPRTPSSNSTTS